MFVWLFKVYQIQFTISVADTQRRVGGDQGRVLPMQCPGTPTPDHARTQVWENTPFSTEIANFEAQLNTIFSGKSDFFAFFVKMRIYVTASDSRHFSMYDVFFITSKLWLQLKCIYA